jgi:hypothetical protein
MSDARNAATTMGVSDDLLVADGAGMIWSSTRLSTALRAGERSHRSATTLHPLLFPETSRTPISPPWRHA